GPCGPPARSGAWRSWLPWLPDAGVRPSPRWSRGPAARPELPWSRGPGARHSPLHSPASRGTADTAGSSYLTPLTCDHLVTYFSRMDPVFRALADPTRRGLLDELFREDGQTLSALEQRVDMTRFGVMKHLKILAEAGLITTRRQGREKL